jgi:WD40 repeat protein
MELDVVAFHPSSRSVYIPGADGRVREVDIQQRQISYEWQAHDTPVRGISISSCGRFLLTAGSSDDIAAWSLSHADQPVQPNSVSRPAWLGEALPLDAAIPEFRTIEFS